MTTSRLPPDIELSVIVPSYNRRKALAEFLGAMEMQTLSPQRYEILIVLDGSTDGSAHLLESWSRQHPDFSLRILQQPNRGQSAARTYGASEAAAPLLLFLDDDIVPGPGCLLAHVQRHRQLNRPAAVLGDAHMPAQPNESYYDLVTRMWWRQMYAERAQRFPHVIYRDFCSNHVSLPRDLFQRVGGFDPDFQGYGGEDYDLGYRLLQAGVDLVLAPDAEAQHNHRGSPRQVYRNLTDEGRNDVRLGTKHPELRSSLRCARCGPAVRAIFLAPRLLRLMLWVGAALLQLCERARLWSTWRWLFGKLRFVAYWIGVTRAFANWRAYRQYLESAPEPHAATLDITDGLPADLSLIWRQGACRLHLRTAHGEIGLVDLNTPPVGRLADHLARQITCSPLLATNTSLAGRYRMVGCG